MKQTTGWRFAVLVGRVSARQRLCRLNGRNRRTLPGRFRCQDLGHPVPSCSKITSTSPAIRGSLFLENPQEVRRISNGICCVLTEKAVKRSGKKASRRNCLRRTASVTMDLPPAHQRLMKTMSTVSLARRESSLSVTMASNSGTRMLVQRRTDGVALRHRLLC